MSSFIMSAIEDMINISFDTDMYFKADMPYSVPHEGHDITQRGTTWCGYPLEA